MKNHPTLIKPFKTILLLVGIITAIYFTRKLIYKPTTNPVFLIQEQLCNPQDPPVKLIYQKSPGKINPNTNFNITIKIVNCSHSVFKPNTHSLVLKSNSSQIYTKIPINRVIEHNGFFTISTNLKSPQKQGTYSFWWQLYNNDQPVYSHLTPDMIFVTNKYHKCDKVNSLKNTSNDVSKALNNCIAKAPDNAIIALNPGKYILKNPLSLVSQQKHITITTDNAENIKTPCLITQGKNCATLIAHPDIPSENNPNSIDNMSLIRFLNLKQINLAHLIIDGNQKNRNRKCLEKAGGQRQNIVIQGDNSQIFYNAIINALCGTGISLGGQNNYLVKNYIAYNGYHPDNWVLSSTTHTVADGASLVGGKATIMSNIFHNNTDVDLIVWGSTGSNIQFNHIIHDNSKYVANAGIMLSTDSIPHNQALETVLGNHRHTIISYNKIDCPHKLCGYGIQLGLKSWSQAYPSITGGVVTHNMINGGIVGINIDGAGTKDFPIAIGFNNIKNSGGVKSKTCLYPTTGNINQAPGDIVKYLDNTNPDTHFSWNCKLASCYFDANYCSKTTLCSSYNYSAWGQCIKGIQTRKILYNSLCVGGKNHPILYKTCFSDREKTIKGAVFCRDQSMPINTGQVRGIKNAIVTIAMDNTPQKTFTTTEDGYFTLTNVHSKFSLYVTDFTNSTYQGMPFGGVTDINKAYVVANAQALQAKCDNISQNKASGLVFKNCKASLLPKISDGFAFVAGDCPNQHRSKPPSSSMPSKSIDQIVINSASPTPKIEPTFKKNIRGAVYCYDYNLPKESGYTRGIKNAALFLKDSNQTYATYSDENGIFSFNKNITSTFDLGIDNLSQATDRNQSIFANKPYVVANAQASQVKCLINQPNKPLIFSNCQTSLLSNSVNDGFAFILGPCNKN